MKARKLKKELKKYCPEMTGERFQKVLSHVREGHIIQTHPHCWLGKGWVSAYSRRSDGTLCEKEFFRLTEEPLTSSQAELLF